MLSNRRGFLQTIAMGVGAAGAASPAQLKLIAAIKRSIIWHGRNKEYAWFHPRATSVPGDPNPTVFMTLQRVFGSDGFGPVHWSESKDLGDSWSTPVPIPGLGRKLNPDGVEEGTCDVVPEYHARTRTILAMGHNVYYKDNKLTRPSEQRWPVYVVRDANGEWTPLRKLEWDNPEANAMYTCGCAQRVTLPDGDILVPLSFGPLGRTDRAVCSARCSFDGRELKIKQSGNTLRLAVKRGLLEPSLAQFQGRYFMTIRAEDDRGYVTTSTDGLHWTEKKAWCWDNGEPLTLSTTQQRWLPHSDGLFLVYTRKKEDNTNVIRWRAPLLVAQVDTKKLTLIRDTEQVVFPLIGDGVNNPDSVAAMGNFHTNAVTPGLSFVTVGESLPKRGYQGDTLLARIEWAAGASRKRARRS